MELTIICPAFNEIKFIEVLVNNLCQDDGLEKEIFIVDGGSTDGTVEAVKQLMAKFKNLRYINNPLRTSTHAFNIGFKSALGSNIAFVGAHASYDKNYFKSGLQYLRAGECDVVGGPLKQQGKSKTGKAIALAMSSKIGVGNTEFRTENKKMYVDSVAFAIYKREVIDRCGLLDESLPINQDDEFHYRIKKNGFRILMVPEMQAVYYVRDSYRKLAMQYFKYGLYKPAVLKKVSGSVRLRHLIPSIFTVYLISLPLCLILNFWLLPLIIYFALIVLRSLTFDASFVIRLLSIPAFPVLHISYGFGFLIGLIKSISK